MNARERKAMNKARIADWENEPILGCSVDDFTTSFEAGWQAAKEASRSDLARAWGEGSVSRRHADGGPVDDNPYGDDS